MRDKSPIGPWRIRRRPRNVIDARPRYLEYCAPISAFLFVGGFAGSLAWPHLFGTNPYLVWFGMIVLSVIIAWWYRRIDRRR